MDVEQKDGHLACFGAYDLRGKVPSQLDEELATRVAQAFTVQFNPTTVIVGRDIRLSSESLVQALIDGFLNMGVDVKDIGLCGTDMMYFATASLGAGGGIMVTASHNPSEYNGMKLVRDQSIPVSGDSGLLELERLAVDGDFPARVGSRGQVELVDILPSYITHLLSFVDVSALKPLRVVTNGGNGNIGPILDALEPHLPLELIKLNCEPDGSFPHGVPNPLLPENRQATVDCMQCQSCDFGVAWDGDFDRCFFFDEQANFIEGYYIVGILARKMLQRYPGSRVIHDPRLTWNTINVVQNLGGIPVVCKTGHAFIKERMRKEDAVYGGEMSAHHYFRDNYYCDSGTIPFLLIAEILSTEGAALGELVADMMAAYPCSGEINATVDDAQAIIARVEEHYAPNAVSVEYIDGLSIDYTEWRFNLRMSNTEPLIRLNVETRGDRTLLDLKVQELLAIIQQ